MRDAIAVLHTFCELKSDPRRDIESIKQRNTDAHTVRVSVPVYVCHSIRIRNPVCHSIFLIYSDSYAEPHLHTNALDNAVRKPKQDIFTHAELQRYCDREPDANSEPQQYLDCESNADALSAANIFANTDIHARGPCALRQHDVFYGRYRRHGHHSADV